VTTTLIAQPARMRSAAGVPVRRSGFVCSAYQRLTAFMLPSA
jgi:hypothetical protein